MTCDNSEANWNRRTGAKDHVLSQADALTKNEEKKHVFWLIQVQIGFFSQSVRLTQYVVLCACLSVCLFQLASESSPVIVARRRSDYCPRGAIFSYRALLQKKKSQHFKMRPVGLKF